jgi:hypothetical protein
MPKQIDGITHIQFTKYRNIFVLCKTLSEKTIILINKLNKIIKMDLDMIEFHNITIIIIFTKYNL